MARKALLGRVSDVDIRLLRVFRAVVDCGGVSAAELELNINRSTISRHLSDLELRLGVRLCERGPGGFAMTQDGERVFEASSQLLAAINTFQTNINDVHNRLTGHLAIALFDKGITNPNAKLAESIKLFDEIAPEVTLEIHVEPTNILESGVLNGRFQLAIIPIHRRSNSLDYVPLYAEQMYLYCGRGHPLFGKQETEVDSQDVQQHKYAGIGFHSPNMMVSHDLKLQRSADAYDEEALAAFILSGCYLGFLPDHFAQVFVERGLMRRICPKDYHYQSDHAAIVRHSPAPSRLVETFLDCLRQAHTPAASGTATP